MSFLIENAFATPRSLIAEDILLRLEADGAPARILQSQSRLLSALISDTRVKRMSEHAERAAEEGTSYRPYEMLVELRGGVWGEIIESRPSIDLYRRNLQRAYVELLAERLEGAADSDLPALVRGELGIMGDAIDALPRDYGDDETRLHVQDLRARIEAALDPQPEASVEPAPVTARGGIGQG